MRRLNLIPGLLSLVCLAHAGEQKGEAFRLPTITTCRGAHDLSLVEAAKGYPVHLRANVTFYDANVDPRHAALFVHDSTGSIFMALPKMPVLPLEPGTFVDVEGVTGTGDYAPVILKPRVKILGKGSLPLTAPRPTMTELLSGSKDGQWIEIEGIIQAVRKEDKDVTFDIATVGGAIPATGPLEPGVEYERLIDSVVQVRGNAVPAFNGEGQMVGARILFPSIQQIKLVKAAGTDSFHIPVTPVSRLLQFVPGVVLRHRAHVRGAVTLYWPGRLLCIQESSRGLCMDSDDREDVRVGEVVDVLGFPTMKEFEPTLENASFRATGPVTAPQPVSVDISEALHGGHDRQLVQIEGDLIGQDRTTGDISLEIRSGQFLYSAVLPQGAAGSSLASWKDGSAVRLTGICEIHMDPRTSGHGSGAVQPASVRILLQSASDVIVLRAPSWWTRSRVLGVLGLVGLMALAAAAWVVVLRRTVDQQTEAIRKSEERLRHLSEHDVLTGLPNRFLLNDRLSMALKQTGRSRCVVALLMIDLDEFKEINDRCGHRVGDQVLREVASRLAEAVRGTDTVARLGGDEFIVLLPDLHEPKEAEGVAAKIIEVLAKPVSVESESLEVSASIGICTTSCSEADPENLLQQADIAMYEAKRCGRNRYQIHGQDMVDL